MVIEVIREDGDNGDWIKGEWDFPYYPDGPWPQNDPRWPLFLESIGETWEHFITLPAYYLAARRKGLPDPVMATNLVYRELKSAEALYVGALVPGAGRATIQAGEGLRAALTLRDTVTEDTDLEGKIFRVLEISDDVVRMEQV